MIEMIGVAADDPSGPNVTHCSLQVRPGEVVALVGATAAGKSLVLDVLAGRRGAVRGVCQVLGFDPADQPQQVRRQLTHVPAEGRLDLSLTLRQQLAWWASVLLVPSDAATRRRAMRHVEIPDRYFDVLGADAPPDCRVKLWLALAMLRGSQALLIDDPVRSVSMAAARDLARVIHEFAKAGSAVLIATRDAAFADRVTPSVVLLEDGRTQSLPSPLPSPTAGHLDGRP